MIARCTGAAPRQRGSNEKCRLIQPSRGALSSGSRTSPPYATITPRSDSSAINSFATGSSRLARTTRIPAPSAASATGVGVSTFLRPCRESSRVTTATTS